MNAITSALSLGYSANQILRYLSQHNPQLAQQISTALNAGHTLDHILRYIGRNQKHIGKLISQEEGPKTNLFKESQRNIHPSLKGMAETALTAGLAGAGAYAISRAVPQLAQQATSLAPGIAPNAPIPSAPPGIPGITSPLAPGAIQGAPQTQQQLTQTAQQPPVSPTIPQQQPQIQPEIKPLDLKSILNKYPGFESKINDMMRAGNVPEAISQYFKNFNPSQTKKIEKETRKSIDEIINEYVKGNISEPDVKRLDMESKDQAILEKTLPKQEKEQIQLEPRSENIKDKAKGLSLSGLKIEKGSNVASPQGIGEIKEIRNGKAIIDVDGKKHQVNEDELIQSPIPEKDLADLYNDVIKGIEKQTGKQVSRNVEWAGYDPTGNELAYKPHGSDRLYIYDEIPKEEIEILTNFLTQRKSTGENFIGAWESGTESPIGAAMYQLIKRLQDARGGKGQEYRNRFDTIYDALELAKKASRKKYEEEKRRKKKAQEPRID